MFPYGMTESPAETDVTLPGASVADAGALPGPSEPPCWTQTNKR